MQRTTITLEEAVLKQIRGRAARENRSLSSLVNDLIRRALRGPAPSGAVRAPAWRTFRTGRSLVDITDRDALYDAMEDR